MQIITYFKMSHDLPEDFKVIFIKTNTPPSIVVHEGARVKKSGPLRVTMGHNGDDYINAVMTVVYKGSYFRIPRIIKK